MIDQNLLNIRPEKPEDITAIFEVHSLAFESDAEAQLVNRLRQKDILFLSMVAEYHGKIVGHLLFTPVAVEFNPHQFRVVGLAPMAVRPELQRQGIGSQLIYNGIKLCRQNDQDVVCVLGHADYYPRFGFKIAREFGLFYRSEKYDPYFFVMELKKNVLQQIEGEVFFNSEFDAM